MKNTLLIFVIAILFYGCEKNEFSAEACAVEMKERFKEELDCSANEGIAIITSKKLFSGTYKRKKIYFVSIVCINCAMAPPSYGYTCNGKRVDIKDFSDVKQIDLVYENNCSLK